MLDALDSIGWSQLAHSHGSAEEVPAHMRALAAGSANRRKEALAYFWEYMLHQGSRYEASPYVVPFLFEVLQGPDCAIRRELIDLLLALAVGYGESFLPDGYDLEIEERRFEEGSWEGLFAYADARSTYYEVHNRAQAFIRYLLPRFQPEVRLSATFAVAHFAQPLAAFYEEIAHHVENEADEAQLQSLILCCGMLGRFANTPNTDVLSPYLDRDHSHTAFGCAARLQQQPYSARRHLLIRCTRFSLH